MLVVEGYGGSAGKPLGLPGQPCSLPALLSKHKCFYLDTCPIPRPFPSLSPSSQSRRSEPGAAPSTMGCRKSQRTRRWDSSDPAFLPPEDIVWEWKDPSPPYCLCLARPVISLSALSCFCPALMHRHFCSTGSVLLPCSGMFWWILSPSAASLQIPKWLSPSTQCGWRRGWR